MDVYMDNAATTAVSARAAAVLADITTSKYGNPSSVHKRGQEAASVLDASRETMARLLGASPKEIYFTSGGSEADNWALYSASRWGLQKGKRHIISSKFEHHAILHPLNKLAKEGFEVTLLDVHENGVVRPEELEKAIRDDTCLVTIMLANNEIGTVQPLGKLAKIARKHGALFHTDAVQAVGHIPVDVNVLGVDMLSLSGHKFNAPKGVGVLFVKNKTPLYIFMEGGAQEKGRRAGTENVAGIAAMAAALEESCANLESSVKKVAALRERLVEALLKIPKTRYNGDKDARLPGVVNVCFEAIEGESLLLMLDRVGICASSGSACTSGSLDPSHVLMAIGLPHEIAHGSLRLSFNEHNTEEEIDYVASKLPPIIEKLRSMSPVWNPLQG